MVESKDLMEVIGLGSWDGSNSTDENLDLFCQSVLFFMEMGLSKLPRSFGTSSIQYTGRNIGLRFLVSLLCFQRSTRRSKKEKPSSHLKGKEEKRPDPEDRL